MASQDQIIAFHYFRLPTQTWSLMLSRVRQLGAKIIYVPVPWGFHEFAENRFDFSGATNPRRDVVGFVDQAATMGFSLRLDLSPTLAAELNLLHQGLPGWLLKNYPEIQTKNAQNEARSPLTPEHPTALKLVERWLDQVSHALLDRHQNPDVSITVQIDPATSTADLDHNSHVAEVQWPVWLRKRYAESGIEALNQAYQPPTPFTSFSKVPLVGPLDTPGFVQDRTEFLAEVTQQAQEAYTALLTGRGWSLSEPIEPPPHAFQVNSDPMEIGASFQWAMTAPLGFDGTPRPNFWLIKQDAITALPETENLIYRLPGADRVIRLSEVKTTCYRLLLSGRLITANLDQHDGRSTLTYHSFDDLGETDLYFTLTDPDAPIAGYISSYLKSLLASQQHSLQRVQALADQLTKAMQPASPTPMATPTTSATLAEAERGLDEAMLALQKATASIGALEQAFAIALDKPEIAVVRPLLGIEGTRLDPVRDTFKSVSTHLATAIPAELDTAFTVAQYQAAYDQTAAAAEQATTLLEQTLRWLRQGLADQSLSPSARFVHSYVETLLQHLTKGVLRQG